MSEIEKAVAYLNDKNALIWSIPPELLPDYIQEHPEQAKTLINNTERVAEIAAELQQWDAMVRAVKFLIACQQAVLDWWGNSTRSQAGEKSRVPGISVAKAEKIIGFSDSALSRWRVALDDPAAYEGRLIEAIRRKAGLDAEHNRVVANSGENEWFTPVRFIDAARKVMGDIDLDPASHELAQHIVQAKHFYTAEDDGLAHEWSGRVWLNPPYAQPLCGQFAAKLVHEVMAGNVEQAVMLTNNCTDTGWFHDAQSEAGGLCFTLGRIRFINLDGRPSDAPLQGQTFFYYGDAASKFAAVFAAFGFVVTPCRP